MAMDHTGSGASLILMMFLHLVTHNGIQSCFNLVYQRYLRSIQPQRSFETSKKLYIPDYLTDHPVLCRPGENCGTKRRTKSTRAVYCVTLDLPASL
ncbi:hypothetical protein EX30DRAFT_13298 [Ascodesmis nigricans]|uniref:Uncharacterized protein n=1 Tax=Ascodesmis nigricans TaxID=341454 RepID=A0A4S2N6Z5_9PEZI|nr:hypothetical protein EX30DRAFT_13298 [Ascodesmis nigricans]